jgi:hypothetical protein
MIKTVQPAACTSTMPPTHCHMREAKVSWRAQRRNAIGAELSNRLPTTHSAGAVAGAAAINARVNSRTE